MFLAAGPASQPPWLPDTITLLRANPPKDGDAEPRDYGAPRARSAGPPAFGELAAFFSPATVGKEVPGPAMRIALYSPGMVGLGHLRRNLLLVRRFAAALPDAAFLLIAEAREVGIFALPDNVDCVSLPAIQKSASGRCASRRLAVDLPTLKGLRSAVVQAAVEQFEPDVLIVDHLPGGALGELLPSLPRLARSGCTLVLGLRDILEEPWRVRLEWERAGHLQVVEDFYDAVWIYGDPRVYDPVTEYGLPPAVVAKAEFMGYLNPVAVPSTDAAPEDADVLAAQLLEAGRTVLCQVGGGGDGQRLAEAFLEADLPAGWSGVLLTGPFMPRGVREALARRALERPHPVRVLNLIAEPTELLRRVSRVITMGGYNSVCEVLALGKQALVVPRTHPRQEQLLRAARMASLGLVDALDPERLTPDALSAWLARPEQPRTGPAPTVDLGGLERATRSLLAILSARAARLRAGTELPTVPRSVVA